MKLISSAFIFSSRRERFDVPDQIQILPEIVALEARMKAADSIVRDISRPFEFARQEAAAERAIRHKADAEFADRRENIHPIAPTAIFDGRFRIHAMLVVKIDDVHVQPLERSLTARSDIFGTSIHTQKLNGP